MAPNTGSRKDKRKAKKDKNGSSADKTQENDAAESKDEPDLLARCQELEAKALRAHADYQNLRRRAQADLEAGLKHHMQPLLEELLLVVDFLDMALSSPATNEETRNLATGVEMTRKKFIQALEAASVEPIAETGVFDPALHDATEALEDPDQEPGTILETLRRGYTWHGSVLRPAKVKVVAGDLKATGPEDEEEVPSEAEETTAEVPDPEAE